VLPFGNTNSLMRFKICSRNCKKGNFKRSKKCKGAYIKPIIFFDHFNVHGCGTDKVLLIAYLLIDDEVLRFQRLLMTIQPVNVTGRIRIFKYKITIELSTLGQTQCLQIAHLLVFPSERSADTEKRLMILLCIILQAYRNLCF